MNKKLYTSAFLFLFFSSVFILGTTYILWRWMYTLNVYTSTFTTFWSYTLCIAEIITLIVFTNFSLLLLQANKLEKIVPDNKLQQDYSKDVFQNGELLTFANYCPSVDIFICTLNEPADMLAATIAGCNSIDYPNFKVYVLDDGRREEIKELTQMLGCNYITREKNIGYKAGNINNALSLTDGEIVVIFDADHIPASTFLRETVYNFADEKVALVQTPQHFGNPDAFQKNLELPDFLANEQDLFYRVIEPGLNEFDSVFCGGTNILIRREHLSAVGNFPESTITEDSLLGLKFHASGYKVIYYNRPLAIGLAASSFEEYIKQRARWARGNVQIIMNPKNWKYYSKLTPSQAFFYLSGVLYFFTPLTRMVYLIAPILFLFFDISPLLILFYQIIAFQICYFSLKFAFISAARVKMNNVIFADVYDLVTSLFTIGGIIKTLFVPECVSKCKFCVTKKECSAIKTNQRYKLVMVLLFIILVLAQFRGIYDILYSEPYSTLAIIANLFWNTTNIIVVAYGIKVVSEKPEKRFYQRVKVDDNLTLSNDDINIKAHVNDISRSGVSIESDELKNIDTKDVEINIDGENNESELIDCEEKKGHYVCKTKFKKPITLYRLSRRYINRLIKFVKFAYKKPDEWDDYFDDKDDKTPKEKP